MSRGLVEQGKRVGKFVIDINVYYSKLPQNMTESSKKKLQVWVNKWLNVA